MKNKKTKKYKYEIQIMLRLNKEEKKLIDRVCNERLTNVRTRAIIEALEQYFINIDYINELEEKIEQLEEKANWADETIRLIKEKTK